MRPYRTPSCPAEPCDSARMGPYRTPSRPEEPGVRLSPPAPALPTPERPWLLLLVLVIGLLPWLGLCVWGRWSQGELGLSTAMVLLAGAALWREYRSTRARARARR